VNGLERDVKEGLRREEERRKEKLRKAQRAAKEGESYHQDGDSDIDGCGEEVVADCQTKTTDDIGNSTIDNEEANSTTIAHLDKLERENTAHLALIDHHKKIASDVLKVRQPYGCFSCSDFHELNECLFYFLGVAQTKKIEVRSSRKLKSITLNRNAYDKGVIDSREIDLNQQAVK
jgi:hypothetical protein